MRSIALSSYTSKIQGNQILFSALILFLGLILASENNKITNIFFYITMLPAGLYLLYQNKSKINAVSMSLLVYLIYAAISTLWGNSGGIDSFKQIKYVVYIATFICVCHHVASSQNRSTLIAGFIFIFGLFLEAHSLYVQLSSIGFDHWIRSFPRLSETTGPFNPIFMALTIGLAGFILIAHHIKNIWWATGSVLMLVVLTLPLQSRTVIVALVVAHGYRLFAHRAFVALGVWIAICMISGMGMLALIGRFSGSVVRDDIWQYTISDWIEKCSLLFGCGNRFNFDIHVQGAYIYHPHSILLSQLLYGGIIGIILLAIFCYALFQRSRDQAPEWIPVFIFSASACATIGHSVLTHPHFLWILLWLPLSLSGILFDKNSHPKDAGE